MSNIKKLMMSAAGGEGLDVDEIFSTYLYDGTGSTQTITNGIDLSGEGGLLWIKDRDGGNSNSLFDTERGITKLIYTDLDLAQDTVGTSVFQSFNTNGFTIGSDGRVNRSGRGYASWTWRKAPSWFDVVTYTGNGNAGLTVSHNLGVTPGIVLIKCTSSAENWRMWHREFATNESIMLNSSGAKTNTVNFLNNTSPTSTTVTLGDFKDCNASGDTYVMYLFAHNNGDGVFGPTGDQDIVKCGSYTYSNGLEVNLGFEPQWLLYKQSSTSGHWRIVDNMRGWGVPSTEKFLYPSLSNSESDGGQIDLTSTGFKVHDAGTGDYIYMAIRRGPLAEPESASDVFAISTYQGSTVPSFTSGFPVDMQLSAYRTPAGNRWLHTRFTGGASLDVQRNISEITSHGQYVDFDRMNGVHMPDFYGAGGNTNILAWMWRRAPNFCDVVAYTGVYDASGKAIDHNLGVEPEMIWAKSRNATGNWYVYHKYISANPETDFVTLNNDSAVADNTHWNDTTPTSTQFFVNNATNSNGDTYIAYLFATLAGVSKVGSTSHTNGASTDVDCGFSNGAKFVLAKRTDASADWFVWDSLRGIVSGNDPYLLLNSQAAEVTNTDYIDPLSSGFSFSSSMNTGSYIFYAIAA